MTARRVTRALGDLFAAQATTRAALTARGAFQIIHVTGPTPPAPTPEPVITRHPRPVELSTALDVVASILAPEPGTTPPAPTPAEAMTATLDTLAANLAELAALMAPLPPADPAKAAPVFAKMVEADSPEGLALLTACNDERDRQEAPIPYDDDPESDFYIPPYLRRAATSTARDTRPEAPRTYTMPTTAPAERNHPAGVNAKLRALGWRPADIRKLSAREADEAAAIGREPPRPVGRAAS